MQEEPTRQTVLGKVLKAIRKWSFSPRELSTPSQTDLIFILLSVDEFPVNISYVKLAIICYVATKGKVSRKDIAEVLTKDYSTIAHNFIELVEQGYLREDPDNKKNKTKYYYITPAGEAVFNNFVAFYQRKIVKTSDNLFKDLPCGTANCKESTQEIQ